VGRATFTIPTKAPQCLDLALFDLGGARPLQRVDRRTTGGKQFRVGTRSSRPALPVGPPICAGFLVDAVQMALTVWSETSSTATTSGIADLDDGEQHADFRRRQLELPRDCFRRYRQIQSRLANEHCHQGQHVGDIALAGSSFERDRNPQSNEARSGL